MEVINEFARKGMWPILRQYLFGSIR